MANERRHRAVLLDAAQLLRGTGVQLALAVVVSLLGASASLALPLVVNRVVASAGSDGPSEIAPSYILLACGLLLVAGLLGAVLQYLLHVVGENVVFTARRSLIRVLLRLPIAEFDQRRSGDLVSRVSSDTTAIRFALSQIVLAGVGGLATMVGAAFALALLDLVLFAITLSILLVFSGITTVMAMAVRKASNSLQGNVGRMTAAVDRAINGIRTIRAGNATDREECTVVEVAREARNAGVKMARVTSVFEPLSMLALQVAVLAVIGIGGFRVARGDMSLADMVSFLMYVFLLVAPLGQLFSALGTLGMALGALDRIMEIQKIPGELPGSTPPQDGCIRHLPIAIEFVDVHFKYSDFDQPRTPSGLAGVSFEALPGQNIAIVGPSGSGKSTILSLIVRFYEPCSGTITLDDRDISQMAPELAREKVAYVEQDAPVLPGTIRDNLTLIASDATDESCWQILEALELGDYVAAHRNGLDALIGEHGVTLSGGERQRLAIGRALLTRPKLLLLDETTSSLDARTEDVVREAIHQLAGGCTRVTVAHRLATVMSADKILVMDRGAIIASGTHAELLESNSLYRELARSQLLVS